MWDIIYHTDKIDVLVVGPDACDYNFPMVYEINPGEKFTKIFSVIIKRKKPRLKTSFKISMNLIHIKDREDLWDFMLEDFGNFRSGKRPYDIVWSNTINH